MIELIEFVDDEIWYSLNVANNRDADEREQAAVRIRPLSMRELRRVENGAVAACEGDITAKIESVRDAVLSKCILAVRNVHRTLYDANSEPKKVDVSTTVDLLEFATDEILLDIYSAIKNQSLLAGGLLKK